MEMSGTHVDTRLGLRRDSWAGDVLGVQVIKAGEAETSGGGVASGRALREQTREPACTALSLPLSSSAADAHRL